MNKENNRLYTLISNKNAIDSKSKQLPQPLSYHQQTIRQKLLGTHKNISSSQESGSDSFNIWDSEVPELNFKQLYQWRSNRYADKSDLSEGCYQRSVKKLFGYKETRQNLSQFFTKPVPEQTRNRKQSVQIPRSLYVPSPELLKLKLKR